MTTDRTTGERLTIEDRKDLLLLLLGARGAKNDGEAVIGVTRLQKYLFLLQHKYATDQRYDLRTRYEFSPYDFGPFDPQLYDDLQFLENANLIERHEAGPEPAAEDEEQRQQAYDWGTVGPELAPWEDDDRIYQFALTDRGRQFVERLQVDEDVRRTLSELKGKWNARPLQELLRWLYKEYPTWAENTKLRHLRGE